MFEMRSRRIIVRRPQKKEPVIWIIDSEQWPHACARECKGAETE